MIMDTPIRKMQKRNDYNRHKLLRKIKRQRQQRKEQDARIAEKELKRKLKLKQPRFAKGKDDVTDPKANVEELLNVQSGLNFNFDPVTGNTIIRDSYGNPINTNSVQYLDELVVPGTDLQKKQQKALFNMTKGQELQMEDQARLQTLFKNPDLLSKLSNDPNAKTIGIDEANNLFADYNEAQRLAENLKDNDRYRMATLANMSSGERVNMVGLGAPALLNSALMYLGGAPGALMSGFASFAGMPTYMPSQLINQAIGGGIADNEKFWLSGNSGSYLTGNPYGDTFLDIFSGGVGQIPQQGLSGLWRHGLGSAVGTGTLAASQGVSDLVFDVNGDEVRTPDAEQKQNMATALSLALASGFGATPKVINSGPKRFNLFGHRFKNPLFNKYSKAYNDQIDRITDLINDITPSNNKRSRQISNNINRIFNLLNKIKLHVRQKPLEMSTKLFDPKITDEMLQKSYRRTRNKYKYDDSNSVFDNFYPDEARELRFKYANRLGNRLIQDYNNDTSFRDETITFTDPISNKTYSEKITNEDFGKLSIDGGGQFYFGEGQLRLSKNSIFSHMNRSPEKSVSSGFKDYIQELENSVRDDKGTPNGLVTGSSVLKAADYIAELPHDTEMITTEARYPKLIKQIDGSEIRSNSFATTLQSKKFWNSDGSGEGDVQIIRENPNTWNATGALALQIYRALYPAEFYKMVKQHEIAIKNGEDISMHNAANWEVPMSAEQLYQSLVDIKNRKKLVANDNFVRWKQDYNNVNKGANRTRSALTYPDQVQNLTNIINDVYTANGFTSPLERFKNLDLKDIAKNEELLRYLGFSDMSIAKNPQMIKNILNAYILSHSSKRTVYGAGNIEQLDQMLRNNIAPQGGQASGIGGNTVEAMYPYSSPRPGDFIGALQPIISKDPNVISKPMDIVNRLNTDVADINVIGKQKQLRQVAMDVFKNDSEIHNMLQKGVDLYDIFNYINRSVERQAMSIKEGTDATQKLAEIFNIGSFKNNHANVYNGNYRGMLMQPNLGIVLPNPSSSPLSIEMGAFDKPKSTGFDAFLSETEYPQLQKKIHNINQNTEKLLGVIKEHPFTTQLEDLINGGTSKLNKYSDEKIASIYTKKYINDIYDILSRYENGEYNSENPIPRSAIKKLNRFLYSANADISAKRKAEANLESKLGIWEIRKFQKRWNDILKQLTDKSEKLRYKQSSYMDRQLQLSRDAYKFKNMHKQLPNDLYNVTGIFTPAISAFTYFDRRRKDYEKNIENSGRKIHGHKYEKETVREQNKSKNKHK